MGKFSVFLVNLQEDAKIREARFVPANESIWLAYEGLQSALRAVRYIIFPITK